MALVDKMSSRVVMVVAYRVDGAEESATADEPCCRNCHRTIVQRHALLKHNGMRR